MRTFLLLPLILATATVTAVAAPSTHLGTEIQVPLELSNGFALIDQTTGQYRVVTVSASNVASTQPSVHTGLPDVTGATSGLLINANEALVLASSTANRLAFADLLTGSSTPLFTDEIGPRFPTFVRKSGADPRDLHIAHTFNSGGDALTHYRDPAGAFINQDIISGFQELPSYQPFYDTTAGARYAAGVQNDGAGTMLFHTFVNASDEIGGSFGALVPEDTLVATNIRRTDTTLMLIGYVVGSPDISLVPIAAPPTLGAVTTRTLPFNVGSIAPADGGIDGFLVTSDDGLRAAHYQIDAANTPILIANFPPPGGDPIRGLVPVPGRGIILLTGPANKPSDRFDFYAWGGAWALKDQGALPNLVPATPSFATLFWFTTEPLVDPASELLELVVNPDWTSKSDPNPIPVNILTETYSGPAAGLDNPSPMAPSPPAGATHLVTNQFLDSISLSALDDTLAHTLPTISVTPPSDTYASPVGIAVNFDDDTTEAFYRLDQFGATWQPYTNVIPVSYNSTYQFYGRNLMDGTPGPIITRTYSFTTGDLTGFDSDGDGVPDFVEAANGLNPNGGADSDVDSYTDLDELLNNGDPDNTAITPAIPTYPFNGEGFRILAQANNASAGEGSNGLPEDPTNPPTLTDGTPIDLHGMTSNLLGSASVQVLTAPASLVGELAADLAIGSAVPDHEWLVLNSPQYFDLEGVAPEVRGGREIYKVIQRPVQTPPPIAPALTGTDIDADSDAWIAAAIAAYASYEQVSAITDLNPIDTALTVVCEASIYDALLNLAPADQTTLGVPQDIPADPGPPAVPLIPGYDQFTLVGNRNGDSARTSLSTQMLEALVNDGLSLEQLFTDLEAAINGSSPSLNTLTNALYNFHVSHSEPTAIPANVIPLLPLPLDVLRGLARGGNLPTDYVGVVSAATVNVAKTELANAIALLTNAYRPTETWTVEVAVAVVAGENYAYTNLASTNPVAFFEADGDRTFLEQGLGLAVGTRFSVTGYTDVTGPAGHDPMELLSLNVVFVPAASDNDGDGNLLDDEWEEFFFGETGAVAPFDTHPVNGYSYLQLFLIGHDPRDECTEIPSEPLANLAPDNIQLIRLPNSNLGISFTFPDDFIDLFEFGASQTGTLDGFLPFATSVLTHPSADLHHLDLGPAASVPERNFFHLLMSLK